MINFLKPCAERRTEPLMIISDNSANCYMFLEKTARFFRVLFSNY